MPMTLTIERPWFVELKGLEKEGVERKYRNGTSREDNTRDKVTDEVQERRRAARLQPRKS